ncbi:MAG: hypothetical protein KH353_05545 [Clostridium sp.]|jgi:hypothetical protein|nr:hypothetical protein [Clostridium sp.]
MIMRKDVMPVNFLKKEHFTGSDQGMRYRMEKTDGDGETVLMVTVWPEPYGYDATPEDKKQRKQFAFSEEGIEQGVEWLNQMRQEHFSGGAGSGEEKDGQIDNGLEERI